MIKWFKKRKCKSGQHSYSSIRKEFGLKNLHDNNDAENKKYPHIGTCRWCNKNVKVDANGYFHEIKKIKYDKK